MHRLTLKTDIFAYLASSHPISEVYYDTSESNAANHSPQQSLGSIAETQFSHLPSRRGQITAAGVIAAIARVGTDRFIKI